MDPVTVRDYPGYRVKSQYAYLLPKIDARPPTYCLTPYCLPEYDVMFKRAMTELDEMESTDYFGGHNSKLC